MILNRRSLPPSQRRTIEVGNIVANAALPPDNQGLLAAVRAWAAANYPGCPVEYITLHLRFLPVAIQLADGPTGLLPAPPPAPAIPALPICEQAGASGDHFSQCIVDILEVLEAAGKPLTSTRLMAELTRAGKEWGRRTVEGYLTMMINDGTLENPKGAKPTGYRFPTGTSDS